MPRQAQAQKSYKNFTLHSRWLSSENIHSISRAAVQRPTIIADEIEIIRVKFNLKSDEKASNQREKASNNSANRQVDVLR